MRRVRFTVITFRTQFVKLPKGCAVFRILRPHRLANFSSTLFCRNEVQVPEKLLESIRQDATNAVADPGKPRSHKDFLNEKRSERTSIEEHDMIQEFHEIRKIIKPETPYLDLRIQDGKYEVTNYFDNSCSQASENGDSKRARQRIRTVKTESPVYKLIAFLKQFVQNKGNLKRHSEKTVVIDKVNLVCEPGKMYLVL